MDGMIFLLTQNIFISTLCRKRGIMEQHDKEHTGKLVITDWLFNSPALLVSPFSHVSICFTLI